MNSPAFFTFFIAAVAAILLAAPLVLGGREQPRGWLRAAALLALLLVPLFGASGAAAYMALAAATALHAFQAWHVARTATLSLGIASVTLLGTAGALAQGAETAAFVFGCASLALRAGLPPLHPGVAELCTNDRYLQVQHNASLLILVIAHLYFIDHFTIAYALAPALVIYGTVLALLYALIALAQRDLAGLFRTSTLMHAGMLMAAVGAGGRGHFGAALLVAVTIVLALSGLALMQSALEARVGRVLLYGTPQGRARAFPKLAAAFAFFAAAGVGLPGTAGFIADDLLLHALWEESPAGAIVIIFASAILAIASLTMLAKGFFGPPVRAVAPDLAASERSVVILLALLLLALGLYPQFLVGAAELVLGI
ncbi:MAG: proton-conducting transporter membrane subunit [Gammaproteobacteria bacterium]